MRRVLGWVGGVVLALITAAWCVTATAGLALSAGLYGTSGTYRVDSCYDSDASRTKSIYVCRGDFTPAGGTAADAHHVRVDDTGQDYPDGSEFDARQGTEPDTVQRVGFWGVVGELWQVSLCVVVLAYQAIKPRGADRRAEAHRREPSRRQRVADRVCHAVLVGLAVCLLSLTAMVAQPST